MGIEDLEGLEYRKLLDPEGELGTLCTVFLPDEKTARKVGDALGCGVVADSGWHVYNNMEHILNQRTVTEAHNPFKHPAYSSSGGDLHYRRGMLPQTDALLNRAINISIGVVDPGLGSGFGITVKADDAAVVKSAEKFRRVCTKYL